MACGSRGERGLGAASLSPAAGIVSVLAMGHIAFGWAICAWEVRMACGSRGGAGAGFVAAARSPTAGIASRGGHVFAMGRLPSVALYACERRAWPAARARAPARASWRHHAPLQQGLFPFSRWAGSRVTRRLPSGRRPALRHARRRCSAWRPPDPAYYPGGLHRSFPRRYGSRSWSAGGAASPYGAAAG